MSEPAPGFLLVLFAVAVLSGGSASVVGFGIGSLLTPLLATRIDTALAVAVVTLPHALATTLRCVLLRRAIDWSVLLRFGLASAAGALAGALLHARIGPGVLTRALGVLLLLTAMAQLTGWSRKWHPQGVLVTGFGLLSGVFGGLAGNQGGLRSAALLAFELSPRAFVATATATGVLVDLARTPVYLWSTGDRLGRLLIPIAVMSAGALLGTLLGERILLGLSPEHFGRVIGVAIALLGIWLLIGGP
jgi:uncharacterized membrane protein YfcA